MPEALRTLGLELRAGWELFLGAGAPGMGLHLPRTPHSLYPALSAHAQKHRGSWPWGLQRQSQSSPHSTHPLPSLPDPHSDLGESERKRPTCWATSGCRTGGLCIQLLAASVRWPALQAGT